MSRRCASLWCQSPTESDRLWCSWCLDHRGCYADGSPRDPRHPWYSGNPELRESAAVRVPERSLVDEGQ
jgi:hypothetical protein